MDVYVGWANTLAILPCRPTHSVRAKPLASIQDPKIVLSFKVHPKLQAVIAASVHSTGDPSRVTTQFCPLVLLMGAHLGGLSRPDFEPFLMHAHRGQTSFQAPTEPAAWQDYHSDVNAGYLADQHCGPEQSAWPT